MAKISQMLYHFPMSRKSQFQGVSSWFNGPNNQAQQDIAKNFPLAGSKRTMQMVMAALSSLGLATRAPRNWMQGAYKQAAAPRPGKNDGF